MGRPFLRLWKQKDKKQSGKGEEFRMKKSIVLILFAAIATFMLVGCGGPAPFEVNLKYIKENTKLRKVQVEQVFRDETGWRVYHTLGDGMLVEEKFYEIGAAHSLNPRPHELYSQIGGEYQSLFKSLGYVKDTKAEKCFYIFKDLDQGEQSYALVLETDLRYNFWGNGIDPKGDTETKMHYVEVHMAKGSSILPGKEPFYYGLGQIETIDVREVK